VAEAKRPGDVRAFAMRIFYAAVSWARRIWLECDFIGAGCMPFRSYPDCRGRSLPGVLNVFRKGRGPRPRVEICDASDCAAEK